MALDARLGVQFTSMLAGIARNLHPKMFADDPTNAMARTAIEHLTILDMLEDDERVDMLNSLADTFDKFVSDATERGVISDEGTKPKRKRNPRFDDPFDDIVANFGKGSDDSDEPLPN